MYDKPGHADALGEHRTNPKGILRVRRLIFSSTNDPDKSGTGHSCTAAHPGDDGASLGIYFASRGGTQYGQPRNLRDWPIDSLAKQRGLECRCHQFQVLSRGLTLGSSRQNHLHAPTSVHSLVRIKQGGLVGLNTFQGTSLRVLVLSGRMHCEGTEANDNHSYQHCRDQAYGLCLEVFHKSARLQVMWISVN